MLVLVHRKLWLQSAIVITHCLSSVVNFSHFQLLFQTRLMDIDETWSVPIVLLFFSSLHVCKLSNAYISDKGV